MELRFESWHSDAQTCFFTILNLNLSISIVLLGNTIWGSTLTVYCIPLACLKFDLLLQKSLINKPLYFQFMMKSHFTRPILFSVELSSNGPCLPYSLRTRAIKMPTQLWGLWPRICLCQSLFPVEEGECLSPPGKWWFLWKLWFIGMFSAETFCLCVHMTCRCLIHWDKKILGKQQANFW